MRLSIAIHTINNCHKNRRAAVLGLILAGPAIQFPGFAVRPHARAEGRLIATHDKIAAIELHAGPSFSPQQQFSKWHKHQSKNPEEGFAFY